MSNYPYDLIAELRHALDQLVARYAAVLASGTPLARRDEAIAESLAATMAENLREVEEFVSEVMSDHDYRVHEAKLVCLRAVQRLAATLAAEIQACRPGEGSSHHILSRQPSQAVA